MKNKKGFTLVELLVVIGILGVLIAIAVPSSIGIANRIKEKMYNSKVKTIEVAAGLWADDNKDKCLSEYGSLTVQKLVEGGYLKADEGTNVTNPNPTSDDDKILNSKTLSSLDVNITSVCSSQLKPGYTAAGKILEDNIKTENGETTGPIQTKTPYFTAGSAANENGLFAASDYNGTSYYFRGAITNNNVKFAGMDWNILRINADGTVRLILNDYINYQGQTVFSFSSSVYSSGRLSPEMVGFTYNNTPGKECTTSHPCEVIYDKEKNEFTNTNFGGTNSDIKNTLEGWYKENLNNVDNKIAYGLFCNDVSYGSGVDDLSGSRLVYGALERIYDFGKNAGHPTVICPEPNTKFGAPRTYGGLYKTKIGLITSDELNMGGFPGYYASNDSNQNFLRRNYLYWTATPGSYDSSDVTVDVSASDGNINSDSTTSRDAVVPVINLKANVKLTGTGTESDPYVVAD